MEFVISEFVLESSFSELPQELDDGSLRVGSTVFENIVPLPLDVRGAVRFSVLSMSGERLVIQGIRATVVPLGKSRYVERFSGM